MFLLLFWSEPFHLFLFRSFAFGSFALLAFLLFSFACGLLWIYIDGIHRGRNALPEEEQNSFDRAFFAIR